MVVRVPRFAELRLQTLCAEAGTLSHKVDEDERGWDFHIEFDFKPFDGPADMRPHPSSAYVQVKSARKAKSYCQIKLSNALLAAQSSQPWFIVFNHRWTERASPEGLCCAFLGSAWIRETLEESSARAQR